MRNDVKLTNAERGRSRHDMVKIINELGCIHGTWRVFEDFLTLSANSICAAAAAANREKEYAAVADRYSLDEVKKFTELFALLVEACERQNGKPEDILGLLFHELELNSKWRGQFFTPPNVCKMCALMLIDKSDTQIKRKGYVGVTEPSCGSGAFPLAFASAMVERGYNPQRQMFAVCRDIDLKCVHMCYLQLSLHGIPAVVIHGNSLTNEVLSEWHTPMFVVCGWSERLRLGRLIGTIQDVLNAPLDEQSATAPVGAFDGTAKFEQLSLF